MTGTTTPNAWARYALLGCVLFLLTIGVVMI